MSTEIKAGGFTTRKSCPRREQITGVSKKVTATAKVGELRGKHGICEPPYYGSKSKYGSLHVNQPRWPRHFEEENWQPKQIVAAQALDIQTLKWGAGKNALTSAASRETVGVTKQVYRQSLRRFRHLLEMIRSSCSYQPRRLGGRTLRQRPSEVAAG